MKENLDPNQVVISREYFNTLITMAKINDVPAGRKDHPGQTIIGRILWHARKYNRQLRSERQAEIECDLVAKRMRRNKRAQILKDYAGKIGKKVYVIDGDKDWPAVVCGECRRDKMRIRVCIVEVGKCGFFYPHIDDIIGHPRG